MLVLCRKVGEKIVIPGLAAEIAVVAIKGKTVRLGISAPADVTVRRVENTGQAHMPTCGPGGRVLPNANSSD
jgi:carbon storage regulator CsrA